MESVNGLESLNTKSRLQNIREKINILDGCLVWALGTMTVTRSEVIRSELGDYFSVALGLRFMQTDAVGYIKGDTSGDTVRKQRFENVKRNVRQMADAHGFPIPLEDLDRIWTDIHDVSVARQDWIRKHAAEDSIHVTAIDTEPTAA
jgi:chorismate mutase